MCKLRSLVVVCALTLWASVASAAVCTPSLAADLHGDHWTITSGAGGLADPGGRILRNGQLYADTFAMALFVDNDKLFALWADGANGGAAVRMIPNPPDGSFLWPAAGDKTCTLPVSPNRAVAHNFMTVGVPAAGYLVDAQERVYMSLDTPRERGANGAVGVPIRNFKRMGEELKLIGCCTVAHVTTLQMCNGTVYLPEFGLRWPEAEPYRQMVTAADIEAVCLAGDQGGVPGSSPGTPAPAPTPTPVPTPAPAPSPTPDPTASPVSVYRNDLGCKPGTVKITRSSVAAKLEAAANMPGHILIGMTGIQNAAIIVTCEPK